jgi:N-acyl-D-aspartate/D-glutamate deacylase
MVAALLHNSVNPGAVFKDLDAIEAANRRGHRLLGQVSCCPLTDGLHAGLSIPGRGAGELEAGARLAGPALAAVLGDPGFRAGVRAELATPTTFRLFNSEWDKVHVVEVARSEHAACEQRSIADIAAAEGRDPLDVMLDLAIAEDLGTVFTAQLLNSDEEAVGRMLNHPHSIVSLSDAGAHLTFFNDAGFGLHLLGHWSRDLGAMSLAEAVRRLTSHPAGVLGLRERGVIRAGFAADLLLFDPARVGRGPEAARARPACRRSAPDHRRARRAWRLGERDPGRRRERPARARAAGGHADHRLRCLSRTAQTTIAARMRWLSRKKRGFGSAMCSSTAARQPEKRSGPPPAWRRSRCDGGTR